MCRRPEYTCTHIAATCTCIQLVVPVVASIGHPTSPRLDMQAACYIQTNTSAVARVDMQQKIVSRRESVSAHMYSASVSSRKPCTCRHRRRDALVNRRDSAVQNMRSVQWKGENKQSLVSHLIVK